METSGGKKQRHMPPRPPPPPPPPYSSAGPKKHRKIQPYAGPSYSSATPSQMNCGGRVAGDGAHQPPDKPPPSQAWPTLCSMMELGTGVRTSPPQPPFQPHHLQRYPYDAAPCPEMAAASSQEAETQAQAGITA